MNMKKTYSGIARSTSGRLRRPERGEATSPTGTGSALKRSFEVEEDASTNPSPISRRTTNPLRSSTSSTSSRFHDMRSLNSESSSRHASDSSSNQRSPKSSLRRVELLGGRVPETVSRRTEISIDISSKQVDSSPSPGIARFGLKRPEVSLQSKATDGPVHRRAEGNHSRPQEPPTPPRRADPPISSSRIPEVSQRRAEPPSPLEISAPSRRAEMHINRQLDTPSPARESENSFISAASITPTFNEYKTPPSVHEPPVRPLERSEVISSYSSNSSSSSSSSIMAETVIPGMHPAMSLEKPSVDFNYVGIDAILEQMRRKAMKQGFELNIMVVGQSGLGKSTLMNTLFKSKVSRKSFPSEAEEKIPKTIEIKSISHDIEEKGVRMKLTVIDTPGFGDQINNENCWRPIMKFINDQYEQYLQEEINIDRKKRIPDSRVHCCIYFIPPTGHCLRPLDVEFMRRLSKVVNIVPVIAKADTLTLEERDFFKKKIREELRANGIDVYPQKEFDEDAEDRMINEKIREMIPFAVVGSDQEYQVNGRRLLGRKTKWGTIEVENIAHCEFAYLRDLLIRTHMQNIKDITSSIHYEMYRVRRLNENNTQANGLGEHHPACREI
ncbi:neuronal-specific septin-3-like isoform X1 [Carassius gibelio]|uniref:neuronal-specific septin-3-like isoform X1 n=2 Tax=Carassius gibelio TaxID=101364 RepID=UPI002278589C|nr:neuronal-specific septin-3-like isoform X1 [Carassius gibelio]